MDVVKWSMEVKMLYAQVMAIQAIPKYLQGGVSIVENKTDEIILR